MSTYDSGLEAGKEYLYFEVVAHALHSRGLEFASGVTGGGCAQFISLLEEIGVDCHSYDPKAGDANHTAASETASISEVIGYMALQKKGKLGMTFSTHGVGIAMSQADMGEYNSKQGRMPLIVFLGANMDGRTGPENFQNIDESRYVSMYGKEYIYKVTPKTEIVDDPYKVNTHGIESSDVKELINLIDKAYKEAKPIILSIPNTFNVKKITVDSDLVNLINNRPELKPDPLSDKAKQQLDDLVTRTNKSDNRTLFIPAAGLKHTIRQYGMKVWNLMNDMMEKMVGNRMMSADNTDLGDAHFHEFVVASHNHNPRLKDAVTQCNSIVFLGGGPTAAITGISQSLSFYKRTPLVIIDPDPDVLASWKKSLNNPKAVFIQADIASAMGYLKGKEYQYRTERAEAAEQIASNLWNEVLFGEELQYVQKMRTLHTEIADAISAHPGTAMIVDSGDGANTSLSQRQNYDGAGTIFYPPQGMLGEVAGATYAFAKHGNFEKIIMFTGDGGMGYSVGELSHLAKLAHEEQKSVVVVVMNNGKHMAVDKGVHFVPSNEEILPKPIQEILKKGIEKTTQLPAVEYNKAVEMFPAYGATGIELSGKKPEEVAAAVENALNQSGLHIIEVLTKEIGKAPPQLNPLAAMAR